MEQDELNKLLKNLQVNNSKVEELEDQLKTEEENLMSLKIDNETTREKYKEQQFLANMYEKESSILREKTTSKSGHKSKLSKELENIHCKIDHVRWQQAKASLILKKERDIRGIYQTKMNERIKMDETEEEPSAESSSGGNVSVAKVEDESNKPAYNSVKKRKQFLQKEIEKMTTVLKEQDEESAHLDTQIAILKKRNAAMKLRLQSKLNEAESERHAWMEKLEHLKRLLRDKMPTD